MTAEEEAYHALCAHTLARGDAEFVHQHVVDAFTAQRADERTKPIALAFALVRLYLMLEQGFTGRQVRRAHMKLARHRRPWPAFTLPSERGRTTVADVIARPAGPERDEAIRTWCASVWAAYAESRQAVGELLRRHGVIG